MPQAGYSGRPLSAKLGLKPEMTCWRYEMPAQIAELLDREVPGQTLLAAPDPGLECAHVFVTGRADLVDWLVLLRAVLAPDGMIWVSWPKKSSGVASTVIEDDIRKHAIKIGLVDIKVCAVDEIWSGLKLVIPVKDRKK